MSRCFPFPPPGYEKKTRTDEADSLLKEKQKKEKKHKKDKEKKERKETSKDKHKDRKEKKEKHKDRKDKDRGKEKNTTSDDKKATGDVLPNTQGGEKLVTNTLHNNGNGESKFIQDLARRIRDEEATESQSVGKIRNGDERSINNTHKNFATEKKPENAVRQVSSCTGQKGTEVMFKPLEKKDQDQAKKMEVEENNHRRERVIMSNMPLDREDVKKSEPKYTTHRSSKEKKEEETKAVQGKLKDVEGGTKLKERDVDTRNFRVQQDLSRESVKNLTSERILGKQNGLETNGFLHENGSRPKMRPVASPVSSVENGRKMEACQTPLELKSVSVLQETVRNNLEAKEHKVNGFIKPKEPKNRPTSSSKVKENGEASSAKKRPHSDLKYLDQILNVPKREESHEVDGIEEEQEWLFGQKTGVKLLKKPKTDSTASSDETLQVWNQALSIESADIVALPYVVPF